jgi:drug/metabolite transporter (DMT)-like permease
MSAAAPIPVRRLLLIYACILLGVFGHASSEFVAVLTGMFGPELTVWRFLIGGTGLVLLALLWPGQRDLVTPLRVEGVRIAVLTIFGMTLAQLFFHWALNFATVIQVATMVSTMPLLVVLVNWAINRGPLSTAKLVSGLGALAGVVILLTDGYLVQVTAAADWSRAFWGVLLAFLCAFVSSFYMVLVRPLYQRWGAVRMTAYCFAIGFLALWPTVGLLWGIWVDPTTLFDRAPGQWAAVLTLGIWNTTIAMALWLGGLAAAPDIGRANYLFFLKPVIAAGLALAFLDQPFTATQLLAVVVVCGCVLVELFWDQIAAALGRRPVVARAERAPR